MSTTPIRLAAALVAVAVAVTAQAQAQTEAGTGVDASLLPTPAPSAAQAVTSPERLPRPNGLLTLELLAGPGGVGAAKGLRASFGLEGGEGWRFELGAGALSESGHGAGRNGVPDGPFDLLRTFVEVSVGRRFGRVEPWAAVGMSTFDVERPSAGPSEQCFVYGAVCVQGGGPGDAGEGITAPAFAAGVRLALSDAILAGVSIRKAVAPKGNLGAFDGLADPAAPWVGLSLAWRLGGGR